MKRASAVAAILLVTLPGLAAGSPRKVHGTLPVITGVTASTVPHGAPPIAPYGSYCFTPLGRVGPVAAAPVGSPCSGPSASGPVPGQTVQ